MKHETPFWDSKPLRIARTVRPQIRDPSNGRFVRHESGRGIASPGSISYRLRRNSCRAKGAIELTLKADNGKLLAEIYGTNSHTKG